MGSSEIVDSGRFAAQKSNFSQTCSLLSQYLKEKGSFGDLSLGLNRNFEPNNGAPVKTMNLLPMIEKNNPDTPAARTPTTVPVNLFPHQAGFGPAFPKEEAAQKKTDLSVVKPEQETAQMTTAQMTIFYGGQVIVFNDFPAEKAKEIMLLASNGSTSPIPSANIFTTNMVPKLAESAAVAVTNLVVTPATSIVQPTFANNLVQETAQRSLQPNVNDLPIARKASLTRFLEKRKDRITARAPYPVEVSKTWMGFPAQFPLQMERQRH